MRFTDRELDIMRVLWAQGPSTVGDVQEALDEELAYNTVLTMLRLMVEKGQVSRERLGRRHTYAAAVPRKVAQATTLQRVRQRLFSGSREEVLLGLVDGQDLTDEELRRMRTLLDSRLRDREDGS